MCAHELYCTRAAEHVYTVQYPGTRSSTSNIIVLLPSTTISYEITVLLSGQVDKHFAARGSTNALGLLPYTAYMYLEVPIIIEMIELPHASKHFVPR